MFEPRPGAFARVQSDGSWGLKFMVNDDLVAPLRCVELFQSLTPLQITEIARQAERVKYRAGDTITKTGADGDAALLIVGGAAEWLDSPLQTTSSSEPIEIGSLIGEMAMFIDYVYGATIVATGVVKCLKISRTAMHALMLEDPTLAEALTGKIAHRLAQLADDLRAIDHDFGGADAGFANGPPAVVVAALH